MKLDENALLVLRQRYLVKDEAGNPIETPERALPEGRLHGRGCGRRPPERTAGGDRGSLLPDDGRSRVSSQLAHAHERGPPAGPACGMFCPARRRLPRFHLRSGEAHGKDPPDRRGYGVSPSPASGRRTTWSDRRWGWRADPSPSSASSTAPTDVMKQGGTRRGANMGIFRIDHPGHRGIRQGQEGPRGADELQPLGRRDGRFHEGVQGGPRFSPHQPENGKRGQRVQARDSAEADRRIRSGLPATPA